MRRKFVVHRNMYRVVCRCGFLDAYSNGFCGLTQARLFIYICVVKPMRLLLFSYLSINLYLSIKSIFSFLC